jgi:hypothetical protein
VLCQEYGHVLGLNHQANGNHSCMDDSSQGWDELTPNSHDYDMLVSIYNHTHSNRALPATTHVDSASSNADVNRTVTQLPNGDLLITFIISGHAQP